MKLLRQRSSKINEENNKFFFVSINCETTAVMWHFLSNVSSENSPPGSGSSTDSDGFGNNNGICSTSPENMKVAKHKAFVEACSLARFDVAKQLLCEPSGGVTIAIDDVIDHENGNTALQSACDRWEIEQIEFLIKAGANVDTLNFNGETALIRACEYLSNFKIVNLLVKNGNANVDILTRLGEVDNALARAFSGRQWTRDHDTAYDNSLQTYFHLRIVKLLVKAGAALKRDPLNLSDYFGAEVMPTLMSRFYAISSFQDDSSPKCARFQISKSDLETIVRPIIVKLIIAARQQATFDRTRFRKSLESSTFHRQYPRLDINEFARQVEAQFPLKLKELCRFAILRRLPTGYRRRVDAIKRELDLTDNLKDYLKFKDLNELMRSLERKAIYNDKSC